MTIQEAVDLVDNVLGQVNATRPQHAQLAEAMDLIKDAVQRDAARLISLTDVARVDQGG